MTEKVRAISMYRYRGGAAEKRLYGGQGTVTEFWIYFGDEEPVKMMGHGPTPGQRKTDAIERARALRNKTMPSTNPDRKQLPLGWADWKSFERYHARTFIKWAEPAPRDLSEERYAIMYSDDRPGAHVIWARVSPNPDVPFRRSSGGFYDIPEEGKKAVPWAVKSAMEHKRKMRANPPSTPSQKRRERRVYLVKTSTGEAGVFKERRKEQDEKDFINALREFMGKEPLRANPDGDNAAAWFALGILAVAGGVIWYATRSEEAKAAELPALPPAPTKCATAAQVKAFAEAKAKAQGSFQWSDPLPTSASTWAPPKATWPPDARAYSVPDCAFYKWQLHEGAPSAWVKDAALTAELDAWAKTHALSGHPVSMFVPGAP